LGYLWGYIIQRALATFSPSKTYREYLVEEAGIKFAHTLADVAGPHETCLCSTREPRHEKESDASVRGT